ncbi:mitochondrial K+-H+ exchange-related-domain-containing protein [Infundibulicybe gibba]|nr:mitochondrial K+-H+ exchange-related-domain-containing protein [Infundibulicybe gibba]
MGSPALQTLRTRNAMRIVALPLTRTHGGPGNVGLVYYQFQIRGGAAQKEKQKEAEKQRRDNGKGKEHQGAMGWLTCRLPEEGVAKWVTNKAGETWTGFGKAEGGWKLRVYKAGEGLVDRMDFEELALKGIDPSLGPSIRHPTTPNSQPVIEKHHKISLIHPPSIAPSSAILENLRATAAARTPKHRKGFWFWFILAPFTTPFMIIPIIPNLPFFFCAWRSWSHYRAWKASQYIQTLLAAGPALDKVYQKHEPSAPSSSKPKSLPKSTPLTSEPTPATLLLARSAVPDIADLFALEKSETVEMYRAIEQARLRSGKLGAKG